MHARSDAPCQRLDACAGARRGVRGAGAASSGTRRADGRGGGYVETAQAPAPASRRRDLAAAHAVPRETSRRFRSASGPTTRRRTSTPRRSRSASRWSRARAEAITLETTTETRPGDRTVFATVFAARERAPAGGSPATSSRSATTSRWSRRAIGPGAAAVPARRSEASWSATEMISVRAGLFRAKHYRYRTPYGERVDYWIDDSVAPIGLIKLEAEQKQHSAFRGGFKFELVATGSGAIPQVTRPARAVRCARCCSGRDCRGRATRASGRSRPRRSFSSAPPPGRVVRLTSPHAPRASPLVVAIACLGGARVRAGSAGAACGGRSTFATSRAPATRRLSRASSASWKSTRR